MSERLRVVMAREDGVSLIEMLAAILILGVALAAFASSTVSSLRAAQLDHRLVVANALATEVVESLQGLQWDDAALYEDEAVSAFGGTTYENENLAVVSGSRSGVDDPVPQPVRTVTRDGFEYRVTTAITWVDDDADGLGADDETGDRDDYKRFVVELEWSVRGTPRDLRVTALRSAETRERPLRPDAPDTVPLDAAACNDAPIDLSATTVDPAQYVRATFPDRDDGSTVTVDLVHAGDAKTWSRTLPKCSYSFPDGPVLFTFEAQDRSTSEIYEATEMVVFGRTLEISNVDVTEIEVDADGRSTCDVIVTVDVDGATPDDLVTAAWEPGPEAVDLGSGQVTPEGARFTHTYLAGTQFGPPGSTTLTIEVDRAYDAETRSLSSTVTLEDEASDAETC